MNNERFMEVFWSGVAGLVGSIFKTAASKGLGISVLVIALSGLVWFVFEIESRRQEDRRELEARIDSTQADLDTCNLQRMEQAVKIARLETRIELLNTKKR